MLLGHSLPFIPGVNCVVTQSKESHLRSVCEASTMPGNLRVLRIMLGTVESPQKICSSPVMVAERGRIRERSIRVTSIFLSLCRGLRSGHSVLFKEITTATSLSQPDHNSPSFLLRYSPPPPICLLITDPNRNPESSIPQWLAKLFLFSCQGQPTLAASL